MSAKMWGNGYRTTTICIDSYDNSVPVGRFYNQCSPDGIRFHGAIDLIKKMETILDQIGSPQSFSCVRSFAEKPSVSMITADQKIIHTGNVATFTTKVLFRQHTSWQGSITWQEGKCEEAFRSVMELLLLIDSAISSKEE